MLKDLENFGEKLLRKSRRLLNHGSENTLYRNRNPRSHALVGVAPAERVRKVHFYLSLDWNSSGAWHYHLPSSPVENRFPIQNDQLSTPKRTETCSSNVVGDSGSSSWRS